MRVAGVVPHMADPLGNAVHTALSFDVREVATPSTSQEYFLVIARR